MFRRISRSVVIAFTLVAFLPPSLWAQKVRTGFDQSTDFSRYKRYAWGQHALVTRQHPEDQARIEKAIVDAVDQHLRTKGFVRDDDRPDFVILYEGGGGPIQSQTGARMDYIRPMEPAWKYSSGSLGGPSLDAWVSVTGNIQFTVVDALSKTVVWWCQASKKYRDPKKGLANMNKEVNEMVRKVFKSFPPPSRK